MTHEVTDKTKSDVERMAGLGVPVRMIAAYIGVADKTLSKHYEIEILRGRAKAGVAVAQALYDKCMAGDTTALIFWCKTQLGWTEKQVNEITTTAPTRIIIEGVSA